MGQYAARIEDVEYAYSASRIRVLETRLLDAATLARLVDAAGAQEAARLIGETDYSTLKAEALEGIDFDQALQIELEKVYDYVRSFTPNSGVVDFLAMRYDFHNLKVLMKQKLLGKGAPREAMSRIGAVGLSRLEKLVDEPAPADDIPREYVSAVEESIRTFEERGDPQFIDLTTDKWMYAFGFRLARELGSDLILEYWKASADLTNVKTLLRVNRLGRDKRFLQSCLLPPGDIPWEALLSLHGEPAEKVVDAFKMTPYSLVLSQGLLSGDGGLTRYEKLADDYLIGIIRKAKYISFGPEPIAAYILARENEVRNLRIIMTGKVNELKPAAIRERLRESYV